MSTRTRNLATPLFEGTQEHKKMPPSQVKLTSLSDPLLVGIAIGLCISLSCGGVHVVLTILARYIAVLRSPGARQVVSMLWSLAAATVAMRVFGYCRHIGCAEEDPEDRNKAEVEREFRVVEGALIGVFVSWTAADIAAGFLSWAMLSLGLMVLAMIWCRLMRRAVLSSSQLPDKLIHPIIV